MAPGSRFDGRRLQQSIRDPRAGTKPARLDCPSKNEVWRRAKTYWEKMFELLRGIFLSLTFQSRDDPSDAYGSMTCAGISSLIIIDENLKKPGDAVDPNGNISCCRELHRHEKVDRALEWMALHFSVQAPGQDTMTKFYYLYGLERAGRISGRRFFGEHDWYRLGAAHLIKTQKGTGAWQGTSGLGEDSEFIATSFALLFLAKGRRPIVIGKYQHADEESDWDVHPLGVHYLVRRMEQAWSAKLNWQTIDGRRATVDDLHEAPILFISGRDQLELNDEQKQNLKMYIESGGFVFVEAAQEMAVGRMWNSIKNFALWSAKLFPGNVL